MARTSTLAIGLLILITACNRGADQSTSNITEGEESTTTARTPTETGDISSGTTDLLWDYQFDTIRNEYRPIKTKQVDADTLSAEKIKRLINQTWPQVQIDHLKISGDTVFIAIPDSEALTQQMGSAGATQFIVSTTYSFTELNAINHVSFAFKEGDHAVPGTYNRNSWDDNTQLGTEKIDYNQ